MDRSHLQPEHEKEKMIKGRTILYAFAVLLVLTCISGFLTKFYVPQVGLFGYAPQTLGQQLVYGCIFAPLWEEAVWRYAPIEILRKLTKFRDIKWPFIVGSGLLFGYWHYGPISVPIQGIAGMVLAWVYIENKFSYLSSVLVHSLWNFMIMAGMPFLLNKF